MRMRNGAQTYPVAAADSGIRETWNSGALRIFGLDCGAACIHRCCDLQIAFPSTCGSRWNNHLAVAGKSGLQSNRRTVTTGRIPFAYRFAPGPSASDGRASPVLRSVAGYRRMTSRWNICGFSFGCTEGCVSPADRASSVSLHRTDTSDRADGGGSRRSVAVAVGIPPFSPSADHCGAGGCTANAKAIPVYAGICDQPYGFRLAARLRGFGEGAAKPCTAPV